MSPKTRFWLHTTGRDILLEAFSPVMILYVAILLKIYKWIELGPYLFEKRFLPLNVTPYLQVRSLWAIELWPLAKWIPLAIIANVLLRKFLEKRKE